MSTAENCGQRRSPPADDDGGGDKRVKAESSSLDEEDQDMCYLCFGEGPDEAGQPLVRDCSCRGGTGWAHLSCIIEYAKQKSLQLIAHDGLDTDGEDFVHVIRSWEFCPNCTFWYQNELAVDIATEFVSFVEGKYPGDQGKYIEALVRNLEAIQHMVGDHQQPKQAEDAKEIANKIISVSEQMKAIDPTLPRHIQQIVADAYSHLGSISFLSGKEGAKSAVENYEKARVISDLIDDAEGVLTAESNIAMAKSEYEGRNGEDELKRCRSLYEHDVKMDEKHEKDSTMTSGWNLAIILKESSHSIEAERLLTKLAAISKQNHGPDHRISKKVEKELKWCKFRHVQLKSRDEMQSFQALRYEQDGKKCVVQGPNACPRNIQEEEIFAVDTTDLRYGLHTPVICHGLEGPLSDLNGKMGDLRSWEEKSEAFKVHFEDKELEPRTVKSENIRILFELPDEST